MKTTIVSMGMSRSSGRDTVLLQVEDEHSGDRIMEVSLSLKELGLLITGLHGVKGTATIFDANVAKKRETKRVYCNKVESYNKEVQRQAVQEDFLQYKEWGWVMQSDGCSSQQNKERHEYVIKRYIDVENPLECERHY